MSECKYDEIERYFPESKRDFYEFTENEKNFRKIYYSKYGHLISAPISMEQLRQMLTIYPFLPQLYPFFSSMARHPSEFRLPAAQSLEASPIYVSRHERYCYPVIHTHDYVEALYVYDGDCRQFICGRTIELHRGDFCILSPDAPHCVLAYEDNNIIINILIKKSLFNCAFFEILKEKHLLAGFFNDILYHSTASPYLIFPTADDGQIRHLIEVMYDENYCRNRYYQNFMTTYFQELILVLLRRYEMYAVVPSPMNTKLNHRIVAVLNYIHVNYSHVTMGELAGFFNYSENYLSKMLKEYTGETFSQLIFELQMKNGALLLENTKKTIAQISQEVGCFDASHFNKKFKKTYGISPAQYRKEKLKC